MLTTELPQTANATPARSTPARSTQAFALRLHGGTEIGRLIPLPLGKLSLGSGPRCSVRLQEAGVHPLHCLIVHEAGGLRVRRWAKETLLNGVPFDEAGLAPGDRLTVGEVELEVLGPASVAEAMGSVERLPLAEAFEPVTTPVAPVSCDEPAPAEIAPSGVKLPGLPRGGNRLTRDRRRKFMAALRFHHNLGLQLEGAVSKLEQQMCELSAGQNCSTDEMARLSGTLATLVEQVDQYHREQAQLEQRQAQWLEQSGDWESRLAEQQQRAADQQHKLSGQQHLLGEQQHELAQQQHTLTEQQREFEEQQRLLGEQRHELAEQRQRLTDQQNRIDGLQHAVNDRRGEDALRDSVRRRGRKLVAGLRQGRDLFLKLNERVAGLEHQAQELQQKAQEAYAERDRLRGEIAKSLQQQDALDTQATAWKAVVEATNRLSDNYRQLAAENTRLAGEVEKFSATRTELAAEKAAAAEMLAAAKAQLHELEERKSELDRQRSQWQEQLQALENRAIERDQLSERFGQRADQLERELERLRAMNEKSSVSLESLNTISDQVAAIRRQQTELAHQHAKWECRVEDCDSRLNDRIRRIGEIEQELEQLRAARKEQALQQSDWWALSEQVTSLRSQQDDWGQVRTALQDRLQECESQLAERTGQLGDFERRLEELAATRTDEAGVTLDWQALHKQVASLESQQAAWEQERTAWQDRIEESDTRLSERTEQLGKIQRQLDELRKAHDDEAAGAVDWATLLGQIAALEQRQFAADEERAAWQARFQKSEAQLAERVEQLAEVERRLDGLRATHSAPAAPASDWAALSEQIAEQFASLRIRLGELEQQRTTWESRIADWETRCTDRLEQFGAVAREVEGLRSAHREQSTQVTELTSLFEQLEALQFQQAAFDQLQAEWQNRVLEWETQLQDRLRQFETFEGELQVLHNAQLTQAALVAQIAARDHGQRDTLETSPQRVAAERAWHDEASSSEHSLPHDDAIPGTIAPAAETNAAVDDETPSEPLVEVADTQPAAPQSVSFLARYADMFSDDDASLERPQPPRPLPDALPAHESESSLGHSAAVEPGAGHGDEESIEQYMAKMMVRIRGDLPGQSAPAIPSADAIDRAKVVERPVVAKSKVPLSTVAIVAEAIHEPMLTHVEELKPKTLAPEFASDMQALRALANQSARHAIGIHTARNLRRNAVTKLVIAVLASAAAVYLVIHAPSSWSLQFVGACVAVLASLYWTQLSVGSLIRAIQVGAFQHFEEDVDLAEEPLPIDVKRPRELESARPVDVEVDLDEDFDPLEPAGGPDVVEVAQVVSEPDVIEDSTETS